MQTGVYRKTRSHCGFWLGNASQPLSVLFPLPVGPSTSIIFSARCSLIPRLLRLGRSVVMFICLVHPTDRPTCLSAHSHQTHCLTE